MYNSVEELHIGVDLALQQLNSNRKQVVKREEKDWFLNATLLQVINNHIDPNSSLPDRGSDSGQRVVDYLNVLKVHYKHSPVIFHDSVNNTSRTALPADYYRKSRITSTALLNIKNTEVNPNIEANSSTVGKLLTTAVSFDIANGTEVEYRSQLKVTIGNNQVFTITSGEFDNIQSVDAKFMMIATMLERLNSVKGLYVYWERYGDQFHGNSFVFVVDASLFNSGTVGAPSIPTDATNVSIILVEGSKQNVETLAYAEGDVIEGSGGKRVPCKVVESEEFDSINDNAFFDSSYIKPNCVIENGYVVVANSNDFKVIDIDMVYYRRPKLINYKTGQSCEIVADDFKVQLVNLTAQKINAFIDEGNYQKMLSENLLLL